jgi:transcriptional repressor NrdR
MRCPLCQADDTRVIETRANDEQGTIRRRRECQECRRRFTTYEHYDEPQLYVIKKDGRRELFNREKILAGVTRACEKLPVGREDIEQVAYDVERELRDALRDEVPSTQIGDMVMLQLHRLHEVAYVRFASVYKEFHEVGAFIDEISKLTERHTYERMAKDQQTLFQG